MAETTEILDLLLDSKVQKQLKKVNPKFNRADLLDAILESWPNGQNGFAKDVYLEFNAAPKGSGIRQAILRLITGLISEESANQDNRPVTEMSDSELEQAIKSIAPALVGIKRGSKNG